MQKQSELPEGWVSAKFEEFTQNLDGKRIPLKSSDRKNRQGQYPYYGASGIIDYIDDYIFDGKFLLISEDGANLVARNTPIAFIANGQFWVNNHAHIVKTYCNIPLEYLSFFFSGVDLFPFITGSAQPKLTKSNLSNIEISLPPLAEQHRIVSAIEALFARLDAANERLDRVPDILKKFRQSVLAAAYEGRLTEGWRGKNPIFPNGQLDEIPSIENRSSYTFEAHEFPKSWIWTDVGKTTSQVQYGTSIKADADEKNGILILRMGNIQDGILDLSDLKYVSKNNEDISSFYVHQGDILFNRTNSPELVGKCAIVDDDIKAIFASYLIRIKCYSDILLSNYLCWWIMSPFGRQWARFVRTDGVSQSNINATKLKSLQIPLPPLLEQHEIVRRVDALFALADSIEAKVAAARERTEKLRQSILAKAFSGALVETEAELARQESRDYEPAEVLLERIKSEQGKSGKKGKAAK